MEDDYDASISLSNKILFDEKQFDLKLTSVPTSRGIRYEAIIIHKGLMKNRSIPSSDRYVLEQKVMAQVVVWDDMWKRQVERNKIAEQRETARLDKEQKKQLAAERTHEAQATLNRIKNTLAHTLKVDDTIDWESLKDKSAFLKPKPKRKARPIKPDHTPIPREPLPDDHEYKPKISLFDLLSASRKAKKIQIAKEAFDRAHDKWKHKCAEIEGHNKAIDDEYAKVIKLLEDEYNREVHSWEKEKQAFEEAQLQANAAIDQRHEQYLQKTPEAIIVTWCYPDQFIRIHSLNNGK